MKAGLELDKGGANFMVFRIATLQAFPYYVFRR